MELAPAPLATERLPGRPARPALAAAAALGVCALVNLVDPNQPGALGTCPWKWATGGLDCPGCGTLRATRALTHGDLLLAADHNLLFVTLVPLFVWGLHGWWRHERGRRPHAPRVPPAATVGLALTLPLWWAVRNLPWFTWLGSGAA